MAGAKRMPMERVIAFGELILDFMILDFKFQPHKATISELPIFNVFFNHKSQILELLIGKG